MRVVGGDDDESVALLLRELQRDLNGLIEVDREEVVQSRLRRYYRLTGAGEQCLADESARLRAQATIAEGRLRARRADFGGATA